jgi:hypothetical protein
LFFPVVYEFASIYFGCDENLTNRLCRDREIRIAFAEHENSGKVESAREKR